MNELADKRLSKLRTYSGPRDPEFRRATFQEILRRKHNHDPNHDRIMEVAITTLHCVFERVTDLAAILQDALSQGAQLSFDKLYTIACVLGCEKQRDNDGIPEFQAAKLLAAIEDVFEQKYEEVVKAAKEGGCRCKLKYIVQALACFVRELRVTPNCADRRCAPAVSSQRRATHRSSP